MGSSAATPHPSLNQVRERADDVLGRARQFERLLRDQADLELKCTSQLVKLWQGQQQAPGDKPQPKTGCDAPAGSEAVSIDTLLLTAFEHGGSSALARLNQATSINNHVVNPLAAQLTQLEAEIQTTKDEHSRAEKVLDAAAASMHKAYLALAAARRDASKASLHLEAARHNFRAKERDLRSAGDDAHKADTEVGKLASDHSRLEQAFAQTQANHFNGIAPGLIKAYERVVTSAQAALLTALAELSNLQIQATHALGEMALQFAAVASNAHPAVDMQDLTLRPRPDEFSALEILAPDERGYGWVTRAAGNAQQTQVLPAARAMHKLLVLVMGRLHVYPADAWAKPDVVIDSSRLRPSDVFQVDPSLFQRPYVFAIRLPFEILYISCETEDDRGKWMRRLRANEEPVNESASRHVRSLELVISEAKDIAPIGQGVFCVIAIGGRPLARTGVKGPVGTPFWGERFTFTEIGEDEDMLGITVYQHKQSMGGLSVKDIEVGTAILPLATLNDNMRDEWVRVLDANQQPVASLRIQADFQDDEVLPHTEYIPLANALWEEPSLLCINEAVPAPRRETIARTLLRVYRAWSMDAAFLLDLCWLEISRTESTALLFRGNSIATKALDQYMKMYGRGYLAAMLTPGLQEIYASRHSCEIDPTRVREWEAATNKKRLMQHAENIWSAVLFSVPHCPAEFKAVFHQLQAMASVQYAGDPTARYTVVTAAFFLRFVCPAILNPKLFDLFPEHPEDNTKRTLTLVAKLLQNLANMAPFGQKEPFMEDCNPFISSNIPVMRSFIDNISRPGASAVITPLQPLDFGRDIALLHRTLDSLYPDIQAYHKNNPSPALDKLLLCLDDLRTPPSQRQSQPRPTDLRLPYITWPPQQLNTDHTSQTLPTGFFFAPQHPVTET